MKIKLSKNQWENIGKKSGWIKVADIGDDFSTIYNLLRPVFELVEESGIDSLTRFYHDGDNPQSFEDDESMQHKVNKAEKVLNMYIDFVRSIDREAIANANDALNNLKAAYHM